MADYETEEQQVEALKNWWKENGTAVITGAALGIAALSGWRGWEWYQEKQAKEASDMFANVQEAVIKNDAESLQAQSDTLRANMTMLKNGLRCASVTVITVSKSLFS